MGSNTVRLRAAPTIGQVGFVAGFVGAIRNRTGDGRYFCVCAKERVL